MRSYIRIQIITNIQHLARMTNYNYNMLNSDLDMMQTMHRCESKYKSKRHLLVTRAELENPSFFWIQRLEKKIIYSLFLPKLS